MCVGAVVEARKHKETGGAKRLDAKKNRPIRLLWAENILSQVRQRFVCPNNFISVCVCVCMCSFVYMYGYVCVSVCSYPLNIVEESASVSFGNKRGSRERKENLRNCNPAQTSTLLALPLSLLSHSFGMGFSHHIYPRPYIFPNRGTKI